MTVSYDVAHWRFWASMDRLERLFSPDEDDSIPAAVFGYEYSMKHASAPVHWCKGPPSALLVSMRNAYDAQFIVQRDVAFQERL